MGPGPTHSCSSNGSTQSLAKLSAFLLDLVRARRPKKSDRTPESKSRIKVQNQSPESILDFDSGTPE